MAAERLENGARRNCPLLGNSSINMYYDNRDTCDNRGEVFSVLSVPRLYNNNLWVNELVQVTKLPL
jgi:hypothetical protein